MLTRVPSQTLFSVATVLGLALSGCGGASSSVVSIVDAAAGAGVGGGCQRLADCRSPLTCDPTTQTCQPAGTTIENAACILSAECAPGYYCSAASKCEKTVGTGVAGAPCADGSECAAGLTCVLQGLNGTCAQAGTGDVSAPCTQTTDCLAGLICLSGTCSKVGAPWLGATCDGQEAAVAQVLFHVPRAGEPASDDFYRLPFPNDIRLQNGKINLTGHPRPGARLLSFDLVDRYLGAIEQDSTGFGVNQTVYFRFSRMPDYNSLTQVGAVALLNITPSSPEYGSPSGLSWTFDGNRTRYICDRYLMIRPPFGHPLRPGTTYAAIVRRMATDTVGSVFGPDDDFSAMLADGVPADPDLAAAWRAYAPLRAYLADANAPIKLTAAELTAVAVFTTERIEDPMIAIQAAIAAAPVPTLSPLVRCGDPGVVSPCDDGLTGDAHTRGCVAPSASFDEYQGTISLPVFQQGTPPYLDPPDGGIILAADGTATIVRNEPVCLSLAVPHGTPPAAGWPLVVYSHGTGGSYRSAIQNFAEDYAGGVDPGGLAVPMAVLGYDGILHGTRNGGSTQDVGALVYNFLNPRAARDNALQAAADLLAIPRAVGAFAPYSIKIDPTRVALYGHSQGGNAASLALAFHAGYGAGVMSGTGGTLIFTILQKTKPVNAGALLPFLLGEDSVGEDDPVLNLMQMYFERSDSVNFGRRLFLDPYAGVTRRHALHVYGTNDSYAPVETQRLYALAAGFSVATPLVDNYPTTYGMTLVAPPIKANQDFGGLDMITAAQIQYQPAESNGTLQYDGHFVSTDNPSAYAAILKFLVTFMRDDAPTIVP